MNGARSGRLAFRLMSAWLLLWVLSAVEVCAWSGMAEGFYWSSENAIHDHSGAFTAHQRGQALELLARDGLDTYFYAPQLVDLVAMFDHRDEVEWRKTFAHASKLRIRLVYGIRPRAMLDSTEAHAVTAKLKQLASLGCTAYALCFDDVAGGSQPEQLKLQVALAASLQQQHPQLEAVFLPASYYGSPDAQAEALAPLDAGLDRNVALVLAGTAANPTSVSLADFPKLPSGRRIVFFDNWAAVDTSARIAWDLGRRVALPSELFGSSNTWGYLLNPCFPLERIVHQLSRVGQLHTELSSAPPAHSSGAIAPAAQQWASFLTEHGFANRTAEHRVQRALDTAISENRRFDSIAEMEAAYPVLLGVF